MLEIVHLRIVCVRQIKMSAKATKHTKHLRRFVLGEEIDLQIEMGSLICLPLHSALAHHDEKREENCFQRETTSVMKLNGNESNAGRPMGLVFQTIQPPNQQT